jgi:hypothetical protein
MPGTYPGFARGGFAGETVLVERRHALMASHDFGVVHCRVVAAAAQLATLAHPHLVHLRIGAQTVDVIWLTTHGTEQQLGNIFVNNEHVLNNSMPYLLLSSTPAQYAQGRWQI